MRSQKSKSYLSQPNMHSKKLRKRVIHVGDETFRRSQRLKSNAEGKVIDPSSNLKEKNASRMSNNLSQTATNMEEHFSCNIDEKTLECKICSKAFHLQDKSFEFNESQKPFESESNLKRPFINYPLRKRIDSKILNAVKLSDYQTKEVKINPKDKLLFDRTRVQTIRQKIPLKNSTAIKEKRCFSCSTCKISFKCKEHLIRHSIIHTGDKPFGCATCKMSFYRKDHLKRHSSIHTEDKPFSCGTCKKAFRVKEHLKRHSSIHTGDKPFSCGTCKKLFSRRDHLKKHFSVHMKDKIVSRVNSNKTFTLKSGLKNRLRIHVSGKSFSCYECSKTFRHKNHLKLHNRIHLKNDTFSCKKCEKTFKKDIYLQRHLIIHSRKNGFARNNNENIFKCKVSIKRRLEGKYKPLDQKTCKKMCNRTDQMKNSPGVCTRSKSLSGENCSKGLNNKYEQLSTICSDTKISSYDSSFPDAILEVNSKLEEKGCTDLKENSLSRNTNMTKTIQNDLIIHLNTKKENSQDCCDYATEKSNRIELNKIKETNISTYSEICTRSKSFSNKNYYKGFDHKDKLGSTTCTVSKSNSSDYLALDKIRKDNNQTEEKICTDAAENCLADNAVLTHTIKNELIHLNTESENSQNYCDNEKKNSTHMKLNRKKKRKFSGYSEFCSRFKSLSIKTREKNFNHIYQLFNTGSTDSRSNYFDWHTPGTIKENSRQRKGQVGIHLAQNYLTDNSHLKQKIENEMIMHINTGTENFLNEKYNRDTIELNPMKRASLSPYLTSSIKNKAYSKEKYGKDFDHEFELYITACTNSKNNLDYSFLDRSGKDDSKLEENAFANFTEKSITGNGPLTQTAENDRMLYSNTENSQDCYDNETNKPNPIESNQMEGTDVSAYSVTCTRSKSFSSKKFEKSFDLKDMVTTTTCSDSEIKYPDCSVLDEISKVNTQLEEKENSITGNTYLKQTIKNELTINLKKKKENSQDCYDNGTKNPNHTELKKLEGTNISAYSAVVTRSKSLSNKNYEKGLDLKDKLTTTTCSDSEIKYPDCSVLDEIAKVNTQLEETEKSITENTYLKQTIKNELTIILEKKKENSQDCYNNRTENPNRTELKKLEGTNISAYSAVVTRSKSLSNINYVKGLDCNEELTNTTCKDSITNSSDNSILGKIRKENAQLEEKVFTHLLENCLIKNSHLEQTIQNKLMVHINTEKDKPQVCCDNEMKSPNNIELNQMKGANTNVYSIFCSYCEEKFKRHGDLQRHLRVHRSSLISAIKRSKIS